MDDRPESPEEFYTASSRNRLTFEDYASHLIKTLSSAQAPRVLIDGLCRMEEVIMYSRAYTAPEALNDAADKNTLFDAFCEFESMTAEAATSPKSPKSPWQKAALQFLEENC
jgi:hypothetical protein